MKRLTLFVSLLLMLMGGAFVVAQAAKATRPKPQIKILRMPTDSPGEAMASRSISGTVKNAPKGSVVVIYAYGDTWYVQPWANAPFTPIKKGRWSSETHGGYEFVALLVKRGYKPEATLGEPPAVGGDVLAIARATPKTR